MCVCACVCNSGLEGGQGSTSRMLGDLVINRCLATTHHLSCPLTLPSSSTPPTLFLCFPPIHCSLAVLRCCSYPPPPFSSPRFPITSPSPLHIVSHYTFLSFSHSFPRAEGWVHLLMGWREKKISEWCELGSCWRGGDERNSIERGGGDGEAEASFADILVQYSTFFFF